MNLSFAGCGFLGIYHVGVAVCFRKYAPHLLLNKISGASAGAISACCLLCDLPLGQISEDALPSRENWMNIIHGYPTRAGEITSDVLRVVSEARAGTLGPFSPSFNVQTVLLEGLARFLPEDAHIRVSGRLHISLTRVYDGKNVIVSHFNSKDDLLQALMASCFVPVFSGLLPPRFHGIRYMDGGFSDNLPILDENTITVSPFCGESDICPRDLSSQLFHVNLANTSIELSKQNINRFTRILFPPKPEVLSGMCKQGFDDALRFLHRNNLISCTRCLSVQSTFEIQESLDDSVDYDPECIECKHHRQEALVANLPDTVVTVFQNAIDSANQGLINWVFKHRSMKLLSILTLPCTLPVDIVYATFTKILASTPKINISLWTVCRILVRQAQDMVYNTKSTKSTNSYGYHEKQHNVEPNIVTNRRSHSVISRLGEPENGASSHALDNLPIDDDTFEQIFNVTTQHDSLMAFYYTDSNNKVKMTEIYDVTDAEAESLQSPTEREVNKQLEFDNDWADDQINFYDNELEGLSEMSIEDCIHNKNIFSDPESEWGRTKSPTYITEFNEDSDRPESDQPHSRCFPCPNPIAYQLSQ